MPQEWETRARPGVVLRPQPPEWASAMSASGRELKAAGAASLCRQNSCHRNAYAQPGFVLRPQPPVEVSRDWMAQHTRDSTSPDSCAVTRKASAPSGSCASLAAPASPG